MKKLVVGCWLLVAGAVMGARAFGATNVPYMDYNATTGAFEAKTCANCTEVTSETAAFANGGWYVVNGEVARGGQIVVNGSAHLILGDGAKLTITNVGGGNAAIDVPAGNALTIYSQQNGTGKLDVTGGGSAAGIGGNNGQSCGTVTINGGRVTAIGQGGGKGIGAGSGTGGATVIIRSGTIRAAGWNGLDGDPRIGGGNVKAWSNDKDDHGPIAGDPKDATGKTDVYCVTVEVEKADGEKLSVVGLDGYGTRDIESIDGKLYLYLPTGNYHFAVDGVFYEASVRTAATTATLDDSQNYVIVMVGELPEHVKTAVWTSGEGSVTNPVVNGFIVEKGTTDVRVIFTADEGYVLDGNPVVYVNFGDESVVNIADAVPKARPTHVSVTLPTETVGYGFAVSNLTVVGSEAKIEPTKAGGTTYLLPIGARVGIYAVPEEGYAVKGEPYIIESVSEEETIDPDSLPSAERLPASVTVTSAKQRWPWNGKVDVGYTLSNTDAGEYYRLITAVTVGDATKTVTNEVGAVSDGNYKTTVDCAALFGADVLARASITMAVRTYSAPAVSAKWRLTGPFLIIDLGGENGKGEFTSVTYETAADLPEGAWTLDGGWADTYKTRYLVMRKVAKGVAYPCQPNSSGTIAGTMTPAKDYWIGVHQVTQEQYARVMGSAMPSSGNEAKPKNDISWDTIRGSAGITAKITEESSACFMQQLCKNTGLGGFDLPTEAQWEIAARAGSKEEYGSYVDDKGHVVKGTSENIGDFAIYNENSGTYGEPGAVGQLRPNLWGLYDTAGNVWEWCRDGDRGMVQDVETPAGGSSFYRVIRGGCYINVADRCRPSYHSSGHAGSANDSVGFRLSRICEPDAQTK